MPRHESKEGPRSQVSVGKHPEHPASGLPRWLKPNLTEHFPTAELILDRSGSVAALKLRPRELGLLVRMAVVRSLHPGMTWAESIKTAAPIPAEEITLRALLKDAARANAES